MARQPMVTRTIKTTNVKALAVDINAQKVTEVTCVLPRTYKDNKAILKALEAQNDGSVKTLKYVDIISAEVEDTLYGMTEAQFITVASKLADRK